VAYVQGIGSVYYDPVGDMVRVQRYAGYLGRGRIKWSYEYYEGGLDLLKRWNVALHRLREALRALALRVPLDPLEELEAIARMAEGAAERGAQLAVRAAMIIDRAASKLGAGRLEAIEAVRRALVALMGGRCCRCGREAGVDELALIGPLCGECYRELSRLRAP